ncbi:hypothetical protein PybrP1_012048, partial [[Pythium] brassicae (nom. inval.)]
VDDGPADQALGLRTVGKAFAGSSGSWKKVGDGILSLIFESTDKYDVRVNVFSGGNKITEVKVPKGKNVTWTKPLAELKDKTMYLDRWRPGLLGIPGTGGGSLLLWIPHSSQGGNLQLHTKINLVLEKKLLESTGARDTAINRIRPEPVIQVEGGVRSRPSTRRNESMMTGGTGWRRDQGTKDKFVRLVVLSFLDDMSVDSATPDSSEHALLQQLLALSLLSKHGNSDTLGAANERFWRAFAFRSCRRCGTTRSSSRCASAALPLLVVTDALDHRVD